MAQFEAAVPSQNRRNDVPVAGAVVPLVAQQAGAAEVRGTGRAVEVALRGLGFHLGGEDAAEGSPCRQPGPRRARISACRARAGGDNRCLATAKSFCERALGEAGPARDRGLADVENERDSSGLERVDEIGQRRALVADGCQDGHGSSPMTSQRSLAEAVGRDRRS